MSNNIPGAESENNSSNEELARQIEKSEYTERKNGSEIYTAENGMKINIKDQEGADQMVDWLRGNPTSSVAAGEDSDFNHAVELHLNDNANNGMTSTSVSPELTNALTSHDAIATEIKAAEARHQEALDSNKKAYSGMTSTGISSGMTSALASQDELTKKTETDTSDRSEMTPEELDKQRLEIHRKLDRTFHRSEHKRLNQGMTATSVSPELTNALGSHDAIAAEIKAAAARHQEALDSNKKAYSGMTSTGISSGMTSALASHDELAAKAKADAQLQETTKPIQETTPEITTTTPVRDLHQEALDRNTKANEGFTGSMTQTGRNALHSQDTIAELAKENARLQEEKELTPEQQELKDIKILIKEQSIQIQQLIIIMQQNITNIHNNTVINGGGIPITEPTIPAENGPVTPEVPLTPAQQEIVDIKIAVTQQSEQINQLIAIMQQTNNININNINGAGTNPTEGADGPIVVPPAETTTTTTTTQETTPVTPEVTPTPETRRKLKVAYIAGAVIGGSTGVLGGVPAAGIGALVCIAGGILNTGLNKWSNSNVERWNRRLATVTDPAERTKLEKRVADWGKVKNFTETTAKDFLRGARHGLLASSIFSGVFLGAHGLAWNTPEAIMPTTPANPTGTGGGNGPEVGGGTTPPEGEPFDSGLVKDGRVVLPGDPSNGNLATGPQSLLNGGELNSNNYAGGPSDRGFWELNNYLNNAHIKVSDLQAAGGDIHRMGYALQVDPTRTLPDLLHQFGGENLLNANASLGGQ